MYFKGDFIEKNQQFVPIELDKIIQDALKPIGCTDTLIDSKSRFQSSSRRFRSELNLLLETLKTTVWYFIFYFIPFHNRIWHDLSYQSLHHLQDTHYIRCIKSNTMNQSDQFDDIFVQSQISAAGVVAYIDFIRFGYPNRLRMEEIYKNFELHLHHSDVMPNPVFLCRILLLSLGLKRSEFIFGTHCVFFRSEYSQLVAKISNPDENFIASSSAQLERIRTKARKSWSFLIVWSKYYTLRKKIFFLC